MMNLDKMNMGPSQTHQTLKIIIDGVNVTNIQKCIIIVLRFSLGCKTCAYHSSTMYIVEL